MIEVKKDKQEKVVSYVVWQLVNEKGHFDKHGKFVWVDDLWIHPDYRNNGIIREFINKITEKSGANYCYFKRKKYDGRMSIYRKFNIYTRRKICWD